MMIAYGICVFTRERFPLFAKKSDLPIESKKLFAVVFDEEKSMDNREQFLRRIRNAVAHMNIKFSQNVSIEDSIGVELWDAKKNRPPNFRVTISVKNFMVFLNEIGHQFGDWWQKYRLSM